jgi:hypothetical protein
MGISYPSSVPLLSNNIQIEYNFRKEVNGLFFYCHTSTYFVYLKIYFNYILGHLLTFLYDFILCIVGLGIRIRIGNWDRDGIGRIGNIETVKSVHIHTK